MALVVQIKKSSVSNKVPLTTDLDFGELALNYTDGKLYYKKSDGTTIDYFKSGISGAVTVADDTTTNSTYYPIFATASSGTLSEVKVSSTKFGFNPSTGNLTLGGSLTTGTTLTTNGNVGINTSAGATPLDVNHVGALTYGFRVGDINTVANSTGIYLRTTSTATIAWDASGKLNFATSGGSVTRFTIGSNGQWGVGASENFGTFGQVFTSNGPSAAPTWTTISGGGGSAVTVSDTAPSSPAANSFWWDSTVGQLRIYYNDGDTSQWVDAINAQGLAGTNGTNGTNGTDGRTLLNGTTDPTTQGADGDFYINTATNYIFGPKASGTWPTGVALAGGGGSTVTTSDTAPSSPTDNSLWFNSTIGQLFIRYNDGSSAQWVAIANEPGTDGVGIPAGGSTGQFMKKATGVDYDTTWGNVVEVTATPVAGEFNNTTTAPTNTNRLNYEGDFYATNLHGSLAVSDINASGTRDSTTFLSGDGTFAVPKGAVSTKETVLVATSGTFTADPKALFTQVICTGGGGGGGGSDWASGYGAAGGGGAGGTASVWYTPAEMGATAAYTVGAAGTSGAAATGGTGGTGGASTFNPIGTGATLTGSGGVGGAGTGTTANTVATVFAGGTGGAASGGDMNREGANGDAGMAMSATFMKGGAGGFSYWGSGAKEVVRTTSGSTAGTAATSNGDGGSGACNSNNTSGVNGGAGAIGKILIIEYLSA